MWKEEGKVWEEEEAARRRVPSLPLGSDYVSSGRKDAVIEGGAGHGGSGRIY